MRFLILFLASLLTASSLTYAVVGFSDTADSTYVTWESLEPDNWSSIWLIKRHIEPSAAIEIRPTGDSLSGGVAFGVPGAKYKRTADLSTFQSLLTQLDQSDAVLQQMGAILYAIETTSWYSGEDSRVDSVERHFRRLQDRHGRAYVPVSCYGHFFDTLYSALAEGLSPAQLDQALIQAVREQDCEGGSTLARRVGPRRVAELSIDQLLSEIASDKKVVFVDTREPAEYAKSHIPGAINIPMRDLDQATFDWLKQADRVISYCVKDFRGYEVARLMAEKGIDQVAVMKPHGLSGWQSHGLPLTVAGASGQLAEEQLLQCARDRSAC